MSTDEMARFARAFEIDRDLAVYGTAYQDAATGKRIDPATVGHAAVPPELEQIGRDLAADLAAKLFRRP